MKPACAPPRRATIFCLFSARAHGPFSSVCPLVACRCDSPLRLLVIHLPVPPRLRYCNSRHCWCLLLLPLHPVYPAFGNNASSYNQLPPSLTARVSLYLAHACRAPRFTLPLSNGWRGVRLSISAASSLHHQVASTPVLPTMPNVKRKLTFSGMLTSSWVAPCRLTLRY